MNYYYSCYNNYNNISEKNKGNQVLLIYLNLTKNSVNLFRYQTDFKSKTKVCV